MLVRPRFILVAIVALAALAAACGGGGENAPAKRVSARSDVDGLLRATFANLGRLHSATMDLKLAIEPQGAGAGSGPVTARITGPFAGQGAGKLPHFAFAATLQSGGRTVTARATYTGEKGYIALQGTQYSVPDKVTRQFVTGYQQAQQSAKTAGGGVVLGGLGVDFTKWLKNARNDGAAQVGDAQTVKLTGDADVARVIDDLGKIAAKARALNLPGASGRVPQQLTPAQKQQAAEAVKAFTVTVYTGAQDKILRRLVVAASLQDSASAINAKLGLDVTFTKVGAEQEITAPKNARPFSELRKATKAAGLGDLGALGAGAGATAGANNVDKYAKCIEKAAGDAAKGRKCADLLSG